MSNKENVFIKLMQGANVIKLFKTYEWPNQDRVFVPGSKLANTRLG
jgi:hypothetical protein